VTWPRARMKNTDDAQEHAPASTAVQPADRSAGAPLPRWIAASIAAMATVRPSERERVMCQLVAGATRRTERAAPPHATVAPRARTIPRVEPRIIGGRVGRRASGEREGAGRILDQQLAEPGVVHAFGPKPGDDVHQQVVVAEPTVLHQRRLVGDV